MKYLETKDGACKLITRYLPLLLKLLADLRDFYVLMGKVMIICFATITFEI